MHPSFQGAQQLFCFLGARENPVSAQRSLQFLAGLGGRDPSSTVERMVAQDIAVQRENFNLQREAGKSKLAGLDTIYGRLRQRGLDDAEAASAARASMKAGLAMRMDDVADVVAAAKVSGRPGKV